MLAKRLLNGPTVPDNYFVRLGSDIHGNFGDDVTASVSADTAVVALSEYRQQDCIKQESLLLMRPYGWVATSAGVWILEPSTKQEWSAKLKLEVVNNGTV